MMPLNLLAFVPFGVLLGAAFIAAAMSIWISFAPGGTPRRAVPKQDAMILQFPAPRRRAAGEAVRRPAQHAAYARTPLAG